MILPNNPKLQKFHYLASISLFVDFIVSGFIIGNYEFQIGIGEPNFMDQENIFFYLIVLQGTDIALTFFKIIKDDGIIKVKEPYDVALEYLKFGFFVDMIAVLPFSVWHP